MIVAAGFDASAGEVSGAVAGRAEVAHARDAEELEALLATPRDWQAILIGPGMHDPLALARAVRVRLPDVPVLLLAEPQAAARIQHDLILAPLRGEPVRCVPLDANAQRAIDQHLRQALLRRRHGQLVRSANQALAAQPAAHPRLPPVMEQLLEATPIPLLVVDRAGKLLHRNRAARALQPARATTLQEALAGVEAPLAQLLDEPEGSRGLRRVAWADRSYDVLASPLVVPPSLDATLVIVDDVTELVRAETERLREADIHATVLAAQSDLGEGMLLTGETIEYANDALARMVGRSREALVGMSPYLLVAPEERERVRDNHARRRQGDPTVQDVYETVFIRADGTRLPVEVSARVFGGGRATVVLARDITRRRAMQQEVETARAGLAQMDKLATMGSLVSGLAHEIRTPLAAIMNEAFLIDRQLARALAAEDARAELQDVRERLAALNDAIDRIRRLMRDMRTFMRGEAPAKARTSIDPCVDDAVRFFAATQRGQVRVRSTLASRAQVEADPAQLQQIVINLLQNATEASASGAEIVVETWDEPDAAALAVIDTGRGIPPEIQARMFEAFVTTKPRGTGLGLTIVRRLAEFHRARVHFDSVVGRGTRVEVRFPRVDAPGSPPQDGWS